MAQLAGVHVAREQLERADEGARVGSADELPRAEHPLHRLRRPPRRALSLLPRPCGALQPAGDQVRRRHGPHVRRTATCWRRSPSTSERRSSRIRPTATSCSGRPRAKALDAVRGILPAGSLSNVGIYGSGQGFEALLLRLQTHLLPEAREYGQLMLHELRKVIPSFLRRPTCPSAVCAGRTTWRRPASGRPSWSTRCSPSSLPSSRRRSR